MKLVTRKPLSFDTDFDRMFHDLFRPGGRVRAGSPVRMDIVEDKDAFKIVAEVPGMEKDMIKIVVNDGLLTISGEKTSDKDSKEDVIWSERYHGEFSRSFRLPDTVDASAISADYTNGLLEVKLPVKEEVKPREIEVKIS